MIYKAPEMDDVFEFGVTGDIAKSPDPYHPLGYMIAERVVYGIDDQFECWIAPDLDEAGDYTGMYTPLSLQDCAELNLKVSHVGRT